MVFISGDYRTVYRHCPNESACPVLNKVPDCLKGFLKSFCDHGIMESPTETGVSIINRYTFCPAYHRRE
jgi:hypothetical protein